MRYTDTQMVELAEQYYLSLINNIGYYAPAGEDCIQCAKRALATAEIFAKAVNEPDTEKN